jgi:hypothetical protein
MSSDAKESRSSPSGLKSPKGPTEQLFNQLVRQTRRCL